MTDETDDGVWRELAREPVADCRIMTVERSIVESPIDHAQHAFYRIRSSDWVQVIPITPRDELVMVRQFRHGPRRWTLEIPGGLLEPDEEPAVAALRECLEETGYRASNAIALGAVNPNPALFTNTLHAFVAENAVAVQAIQNTGNEQTEVVLLPVSRLHEALVSGQIDHALVTGTLWRYLYERGPR